MNSDLDSASMGSGTDWGGESARAGSNGAGGGEALPVHTSQCWSYTWFPCWDVVLFPPDEPVCWLKMSSIPPPPVVLESD